jgi:small subunit ribosomal protein S3Ae
MSLGKNKKNFSKGRKGAKKKVGERFLKKEWWNIKAPGMFAKRMFTYSPVNQTVGKKLASDSMKGRVFEANLGDLNQGFESNKKVKLIVEDADGKSKIAMTNFYGLECTRDYLCSLIRKWHTLIDTFVDCKTNDGFLMRFFIVAFTSKYEYTQKKATCYANRSQVKQMRAIMTKIITKVCKASTLKELVNKVLGNELTDEMAKKCKHIFPLENVTIRKVKSIKRPKIDMNQLNAMHTESELAGVELPKKNEGEGEEGKEEKFI